jgi:hypothetical protein
MMTDDNITVSSPTVNAPEPQPSHAQAIDAAFQANLNLIAKADDGTDYVRERIVQEKHRNGQDITGAEQNEWHGRHAAALQRAKDAASVARGETPPSQQPPPTELPGYVAPNAPDYDAKFAEAKERFDTYFNDPERIGGSLSAQDHKDQITSWLSIYDPSEKLTGHFMASPLGPQMAETIVMEGGPDLIQKIANMPPRERAASFQKLEGYLYAREQQQQQQNGMQRAQNPPPRQWTQAPPIIRPPRGGGANPPQDLYALAQRDDGTAYIKARRAQEKRASEDR